MKTSVKIHVRITGAKTQLKYSKERQVPSDNNSDKMINEHISKVLIMFKGVTIQLTKHDDNGNTV